MDIMQKSHWHADANRVSLAMPIAKIDKENRLVSGYATLDNIDTSDDVVLASASVGAFTRFRGNIREMHQPIAAGRLVDFKEDSYYDSKTKKFYRGVFVTAYVSKGAADTWEKVLDGTLSGFSIGGNITEQESQFVKDAGPDGKTIRFIKAYDLTELSLVDNPANQLANVFSIVKSADGSTMMKGMVAETTLTNVFWCAEDEIAKNSTQENESCLSCGNKMVQIGWFEKGEDEAVKTAAAVATFLRQKEDEGTDTAEAIGEGGVNMADEIVKNAEDSDVVVSEEVSAEETVTDEAPSEVTTEDEAAVAPEAAEVVGEVAAEPDFEKMIDDLKGAVNDSLVKSQETVEQAVERVNAHVQEVTKAFDDKASEFEKSISELGNKLEQIKTERESVTKRLDALESATAIKKSGEVETEPEKKVQKGLWAGTFFEKE